MFYVLNLDNDVVFESETQIDALLWIDEQSRPWEYRVSLYGTEDTEEWRNGDDDDWVVRDMDFEN